jgi:mRNA-degrading endonuclease toxin of MazEF toxin-antitoxin module
MRRGEVWKINAPNGVRTVLVLSIAEANELCQVSVVVDLRDAEAAPDAMLSVRLKEPVPATAFGMNLMQVNASRFDPASGAVRLGSVSQTDMARVWEAVRAVLGP